MRFLLQAWSGRARQLMARWLAPLRVQHPTDRHRDSPSEQVSAQKALIAAFVSSREYRHGTRAEAIAALLRPLCSVLTVDRVSLWLCTPDGRACEREFLYETGNETTNVGFTRLEWADVPEYRDALTRNDVLAAPDVQCAPYFAQVHQRFPELAKLKSRINAPLYRDGALMGEIVASTVNRHVAWTSEQIEFMREIAMLATLVLERHERLASERRLEESNAQLAATAERAARSRAQISLHKAATAALIGGDAFRSGTRKDAIEALLRTVGQVLDCDRVAFWLDTDDGKRCVLDAFVVNGDVVHMPGAAVEWASQVKLRAALDQRDVIAVSDVMTAPHLQELLTTYPPAQLPKSRIEMPLLRDGRFVGMIIATTMTRRAEWTSDDIQLMREFGTITVLILERHDRLASELRLRVSNAELATEVARRERTERTLRARQRTISELIAQVTAGSDSREAALRAILEISRTTLDLDRVAIWLSDQHDENCLRLLASQTGAEPNGMQHEFAWADLPIYRAALERGHPLVADDGLRSAHLVEIAKTLPPAFNSMSRVDLPIKVGGKLLGVLMGTTFDGRRSWFGEDVVFLSAISGVVALVIEQHERLRVEKDLRDANRQVAAASKAKSLFLANMSHEIRTPMNGVFGMTDLLMRTELTERQARLVQTVNQSARTLLTIINDILDLSRIEAGKLELDQHPFNLRKTVEGAVELFVEDTRRKGLELTVFVDADVPHLVLGDAGRLRQLCINVIGNAVKFTQTGDVDVRVTCAEPGDDGDAAIAIEVRDTGIGISTEMRERIFQPFAQADSSISRRFGGTGLGLSISMHLARLMGGDITLDSKEGEGTCVRLIVPLAAVEGSTATRAEVSALKGRRALVVDDRKTNREIIADYLSGCGMLVDVACDGSDALARAANASERGGPFDLVVVDMLMPDMDGLELTARVRALPGMAAAGIVMVTSLSWKGDARAARERGVGALLTKPVRREDLLDACLTACGNAVGSVGEEAAPRSPVWNLSGHVLLAEDNPVNVEVASEYLSMLGVTCTVASNGREAEALFRTMRFDAVLMDCQMPDVDGRAATETIRALEAQEGRVRTPIIAVTAHAFEADRIACLKSGMDDYLSKPFGEQQLAACLSRWLDGAAVTQSNQLAPLDSGVIASMVRDCPTVFARLAGTYLTQGPRLVADLVDAASSGNAAALEAAAHSLRTGSAALGASQLAALCETIERCATDQDPAAAVETIRAVQSEYRSVAAAVKAQQRALAS